MKIASYHKKILQGLKIEKWMCLSDMFLCSGNCVKNKKSSPSYNLTEYSNVFMVSKKTSFY